jgi:MinD-like ATPase involved in chromosome partitioning or flagellar assembly
MNNEGPILYYTWLDVEFAFEQLRAQKELPIWVVGASFYYSEAVLKVVSGTHSDEVEDFLVGLFGRRYSSPHGLSLESTPDFPRLYPFEIEEVSGDQLPPLTAMPLFRRVSSFPETAALFETSEHDLVDGSPEMIAFYSFKGGVGRTTHLLAYVQALTERGLRALVIDADLEAPGISALLDHESSFRQAQFSFLDLISLAQSDSSSEFEDTLNLATFQTRRQSLDLTASERTVDHYFLPAHRNTFQAMRLDIRPEHLLQRPNKAWAVSDLIAALGRRLGVDAVVIDLRAGFSELSAPFLFDQRVRRVLVTTPSRQSIDGLSLVLKQVRKSANSQSVGRSPLIIMSFVLPELLGSEIIGESISQLVGALGTGYSEKTDPDEASILSGVPVSVTLFTQELLYVSSVTDAFTKLQGTSLAKSMSTLSKVDIEQVVSAASLVREGLDEIRQTLYDLAFGAEYAESGKGETLLRVAPLRALARQFANEIPVAVILGSKGSGKTYTYLQVVRARNWQRFTEKIGQVDADINAVVWPFLRSKNLQQTAEILVEECRTEASSTLKLSSSSNTLILDSLRDALRQKDTDETWWRNRWFRLIGQSLGLATQSDSEAAEFLLGELAKRKQAVVVVIDGLEDIFTDLATRSEQKVALRALIQDVPAFLREVPENLLGLLVFVRADLAQLAIVQNYGQFAKLYEPFALRWSETDALRLALWFAKEAGVPLSLANTTPIELATADQARDELVLLWGRKLGSERSREARSAEWILAALSDFNGQVQARDLVRLLRHASEASLGSQFSDRVLAPRAIRESITPCSLEKIEEIKQEIPQLANVFLKLQDNDDLRIPFDAASAGLNLDDVRFLQRVGILFEDHGLYFIPEIFRLGLGFRLAEGARPRVLSIGRRISN